MKKYLILLVAFFLLISSIDAKNIYIYTMENGSFILDRYKYVSQTVSLQWQNEIDEYYTVYNITCSQPGWTSCKVRNHSDDFSICYTSSAEETILEAIRNSIDSGLLQGSSSMTISCNNVIYNYNYSWDFRNSENGDIVVEQIGS